MQTVLGELKTLGGAGLHFLTETTTSPTLAAQFAGVLAAIPGAKWHQYDPVTPDGVHQGGQLAFGAPVHVHYKLDQAQAIVALDADLFGAGTPGNVRYARDFASGRRVRRARAEMNRLYVAEPTPIGHRIGRRPSAAAEGQPGGRRRARDPRRRPGRRGRLAGRQGDSTALSAPP